MPEGESLREFHARVIDALGRIAAAHKQQTVMVVTHGGVLDMVWRTVNELGLNGPRQSAIPNAGFNRSSNEDHRLILAACRGGDAEAAAQAVAAHVEGVKDIVLDLYARHHARG